MSNYTNQMVSALQDGAVTDYNTAAEYASDYALSVRSVIAKVKSLGLEYTPKARVVGVKVAKVTKQELADAICKGWGYPVPSLVNLTVADLNIILENQA